ncbi:MAG: hypothetical protein SGI96_09930 [Bacteroidota bacterium]|nr:hypothetical protein [Chitinophagaceae bacterium]MDZ4808576.1 hypothetical protein [Bacteroidota bacterium]
MKKVAIFIFASILLSASCSKKKVEEVKADLLIQILTDGQWSVTLLTANTTDYTPAFAGHRFKFYENRTVDATNNGILEKTGTWDASSTSMTTSSNFVGATHPLILLNGTWNITQSSSRIVKATQTNGTEVKTVNLYRE